ncbi:MAG: ABC transporter ATP-binding protein [Proteobacteria bacterium]|nr:ABC transporter ATP-binding protein [Pseudomonadota bacterium]
MSEVTLAAEGLATRIDTTAGELRAVDGVDFELRKGECFALVGESGCGKSMTALSLLRLLPESGRIAGGRVLLKGHDLLALPEAAMRAVRGRRVAMIFQEPSTALNPVLTVGRQVLEVIERHLGLAGEEAKRRALALLESVGIPDAARRFDEYPFQLSGGLKQRVMIAAALAADPEVLVADEPTTALDVTIQAQILELLARLQAERGMALLLITHDLAIVAQMAHRVAVMYAGQVVELATREQFFRAPQHPYSRKLFDAVPTPEKRSGELAVIPGQVPSLLADFRGCRFAERCDEAFERCKWVAPNLVELPGGHLSRCLLREKGPAAPPGVVTVVAGRRSSSAGESAVLLEVADLKVHFPIRRGLFKRTVGHVKAVDGVSLQIREGRTLALVGESGCGKTTVGKAILRLIAPTGGMVRHAGADLATLSGEDLRLRRRAMQIVFQDPYASLNPRMRVGDILAEGMRALHVGGDEAGRAARIDVLLDQVGLPRSALARYPHEFSGGQRQRIAIARALAVEPRLIICDEPTSALDVSVQAQILNLLRELQSRLGLAYLFITHNLSVVEYLAHEVAVMYLGRIVEQGTVDEVLGSPRHPYTEALLSAVPQIEGQRRIVRLAGDLPSPANPPAGCHFHPRCPKAMPECARVWPETARLSPTRTVNCLLCRTDLSL